MKHVAPYIISRTVLSMGILSLSFHSVFAAGSCPVDTPFQGLQEYEEQLSDVLSELSSVSGKCGILDAKRNDNITASVERVGDTIASATSRAWSFSDYSSSFRFQFELLFKSNIPNAVKAQDRKLSNLHQKILSTFKSAGKNCSMESVVEDIGGDAYSTKGKTVNEVLSELLATHMKIQGYYRLSVLWDELEDDATLLLVKPWFVPSMASYYAPDRMQQCKDETGSSERILKDLDGLFSWAGKIESGMDEWRKAIKLLEWALSDDEETMKYYEQKYNTVLKIGLWWNGVTASLGIWQKYGGCANEESAGEENSQILCIKKNTMKSTSLASRFLKKTEDLEKQAKTTDEWLETVQAQRQQVNFWKSIVEDYSAAKQLAGLGGPNNEAIDLESIGTVVDMHMRLQELNKKLENDYIPTAEAVCNKQNKSGWNCKFR